MSTVTLPCHTPPTAGDNAGVIAPPPLIFAVGIGTGLLLNLALPALPISATVATSVAIVLGTVGAVLAVSFVRAFRRARTPLDPGQPTTALVTTGVYRFTRNPAYLGMALADAAITVATASLGAALLLLPTLYIIDCGVIQREERYLQNKFGDQYRQYQRAVRRWL
jgi:protein-S-isoprenylcysteine O-methyltransferase Ste14